MSHKFMFGTDDDIPVKLAEGFKFSLCDDECPYLCPTEAEQNAEKKRKKEYKAKVPRDWWKHVCYRYNQQVYHGPIHPEIIAVKGCKYSIKGDRKCQKEIPNVNCMEIALSSPQ